MFCPGDINIESHFSANCSGVSVLKRLPKKLPESRRKGLEDSNNLISLAYQNKGGADLIVL